MDALARRGGQTAFGTGTSIACQDLMAQTGAYFPQAHLDAETMAHLALAGHTVLGLDMVMPLFSVSHEAAALGCNVNWGGPSAMPESGPAIWHKADDIRIPPDFLDRPACRTPLKAIGLLKKRLGDSAAVCGKVFGPWTLGYHLFGVEDFLIGTIDDPDQTRRIIDRLLPITVQFGRAQVEAGADCLLLADHATRDLCSPEAYRDFLIEVHARLARELPAPAILHICGNTSDRIGMIARTGLACFHWDTKTGPPQAVRALAGAKLSLMGGVCNFDLLRGTPDIVRAQARAARGHIDIIGPECAIPLATPLANLMAIVG
jgi:[methyl-Co(III) methanol-specific corrinoid protein]:coenzyme M methyltransferase